MKHFTVLLFALISLQGFSQEKKAEAVTMPIKTEIVQEKSLVRLYRRPDARVKKALSFTTKRSTQLA